MMNRLHTFLSVPTCAATTRCRHKGEWSKCVEIFDAMKAQGVETNTIVYNATMSACSKNGSVGTDGK